MAELNKIGFLLFVTLMIFPTKALYVILKDGKGDFKYKTHINADITDDGKIKYNGTNDDNIYWAECNTTKVIVYITSHTKMARQILTTENKPKRLKIAELLGKKNLELLYLGVKDIAPGNERLIDEFILGTVKPHSQQQQFFTIEIITDDYMIRNFVRRSSLLKNYKEDPEVCGNNLRGTLEYLSITDPNGYQDGGEDDNEQNTFAACSTQTLPVVVTDGVSNIKYKTVINVNTTDDGNRIYVGRGDERVYCAKRGTTTVILYIISYTKMCRQILTTENAAKRLQIAEHLSEKNYELLYLGVKDFAPDDERVIGEFILETVKPYPQQLNFTIETIGEEHLNRNFSSTLRPFKTYEEHPDVCGNNLQGLLRSLSIPVGKGFRDGEEDGGIQIAPVTFPMQTLPVVFTDGVSKLWYATEIKYNTTDGKKIYLGRSNVYTRWAKCETTKAILYITSHSTMTRQILKIENMPQRLEIAEQLSKKNYELFYLGVKDFTMFDTHLIGEFILETVKHRPEQQQFLTIQTIGEKNCNRIFSSTLCRYKRYEEDPEVCENNLQGLLRNLSIIQGMGSSSAPSAMMNLH